MFSPFHLSYFPAAKVWCLAIIATLVAFFAPVHVLVTCVVSLVVVDFICGIGAAIKRGVPVTSNRMRMSVAKLIAYLGAVLITHVISHGILDDLVPLTGAVATIVALAEAKSIFENLGIITGQQDLFAAILGKLNAAAGSNGAHKDGGA